MYHEDPVKVLLSTDTAPSVWKYGVMGWAESSTMEGSAASVTPEVDAGPVKPMVANVSSANSGKVVKNAGLMPDAFQLELNALLYAPSGVLIDKALVVAVHRAHAVGVLHVDVEAIGRQTLLNDGKTHRQVVLSRAQGCRPHEQERTKRKMFHECERIRDLGQLGGES